MGKRKKRIALTLDDELKGLVDQVARLRGISASRLVAELVGTYRDELRETAERLRSHKGRRRAR